MSRLLSWSTNAFPLWVLACSGIALVQPAWPTWFAGPWIVLGSAVIMLGLGLALTVEDLSSVIGRPLAGWGALARPAQEMTPDSFRP